MLRIVIFLLQLFVSGVALANTSIYLIGDSTMADKPDPVNNPERGWGQMLPEFLVANVNVKNHAANGRSSKSFIDEGRWQAVYSLLQRGDYVFIQFGHNDQKYKDPARFTNPQTAYRQNLIRYIDEARQKGAIPVLFTSVVRRHFNEFGTLEDSHGLYPWVMRQVANEFDVPLVDLQLLSEQLVLSYGESQSRDLYLWTEPGQYPSYPDARQDNTHFSVKGAREIAKLATSELFNQNILNPTLINLSSISSE